MDNGPKIEAIKRTIRRIGSKLRDERKKADFSLRDVAERLSNNSWTISASQISRIENGEVAADINQIINLAELYNIPLNSLFEPKKEPFYIVRSEIAKTRIQEVIAGDLRFRRRNHSHNQMMDSIYKHIPLDDGDDFIESDNDKQGSLKQIMRKYLFYVKHADRKEIKLDSHSGEEIIYVIKGQMNFWYGEEPSDDNDENLKMLPLFEGDVLHFSSYLPHAFSNSGKDEYAEALFVYSDAFFTQSLFDPEPETSEKQL